MMLSEIKGERTFEVMADLIEPALAIAQDSEVSNMFNPVKPEEVPEGMTAEQYQVERSSKCLPLLLRKHKDALTAILATIEGVGKEEYIESLTPVKLFSDFSNMLKDPVMRAFLS